MAITTDRYESIVAKVSLLVSAWPALGHICDTLLTPIRGFFWDSPPSRGPKFLGEDRIGPDYDGAANGHKQSRRSYCVGITFPEGSELCIRCPKASL